MSTTCIELLYARLINSIQNYAGDNGDEDEDMADGEDDDEDDAELDE
jgi:hypothetical protein